MTAPALHTCCPLCEQKDAPHLVTASRAGGIAIFIHTEHGNAFLEGPPELGVQSAAGLLSSCAKAWELAGAEVPREVRAALTLLAQHLTPVVDLPSGEAVH